MKAIPNTIGGSNSIPFAIYSRGDLLALVATPPDDRRKITLENYKLISSSGGEAHVVRTDCPTTGRHDG